MILKCTAKWLIFAVVCFAGCVLYINEVTELSCGIRISDVHSESANANMILKNNNLLPYGIYKSVLEVTQCYDRPLKPLVQRRGDFWVLYNYVRAENQHRCFESVTYTTQGDYTFLDNIIPLVEHWKGPISVALHSPGDDFWPTLDSISYLRNCETVLIKQYLTFHLFFRSKYIPNTSSVKLLSEVYEDTYNCSQGAPYKDKDYKSLYKTKQKLTYPINVARNIARTSAQTHFVLASDIELYPSSNLISKFLFMVARRAELFKDKSPKIFVLPVFEILANQSVPQNKTVLQEMEKTRRAFYFHRRICRTCHEIPQDAEWLKLLETDDLNVFVTVKRQGKHSHWEAFYIGTNEEPLFDERLSWEGQNNKMAQAYAMCLLNYDYMVLDNAFLVHKPGLKNAKFQFRHHMDQIWKTRCLLNTRIKTEMDLLYGKRQGCKIQHEL